MNWSGFTEDYSFLSNFNPYNVSFLSALCFSLASCGGEGSSAADDVPSPIVVPTNTASIAPAETRTFTKIISSPIIGGKISLSFEALTIADITGDGYLDVVMSNGGNGSAPGWQVNKTPISSTDNRTTILINSGNNQFTQLNMDHTNPTGWVNDWLIVQQPNQSTPYIIGIDHGREFGDIENFNQWVSPLRVFQHKSGSVVELTDTIVNNPRKYFHNASNYGDLNNDGYQDFVTAEMGQLSIFYGDPKNVFIEVTDNVLGANHKFNSYGSKEYTGISGATVIIDIGNDGQKDFVALPYVRHDSAHDIDYTQGDVFKYSNGSFHSHYTFNAKTTDTPANYGYANAKVIDLNNDGLQDIVGLLEVNSGSNQKMVGILLQKSDGSFDVQFIKQNGSVFLGPNDHAYQVDPKFEIFDIDGDKNLDLYINIFSGRDTYKTEGVFFGDGSGNFSQDLTKAEKVFKDITWEGTARTVMADFNNDGLGDLLVLQEGFVQGASAITTMVFLNQTTFG